MRKVSEMARKCLKSSLSTSTIRVQRRLLEHLTVLVANLKAKMVKYPCDRLRMIYHERNIRDLVNINSLLGVKGSLEHLTVLVVNLKSNGSSGLIQSYGLYLLSPNKYNIKLFSIVRIVPWIL